MWKVLLVDDDVPMIKYWSKRLPWRSLELEVAGLAHSGEKALELFRRTSPDVLITDIGMPQMDGLELAAKIRELKPDTRIIFLTCHEDFSYARKAIQLNADDYMIKDEMSEGQFLETLQNVVKVLKEEHSKEGERYYLQDIIRDRELMKQRFFHQLLTASHPEEMLEYGSQIGIRWDGSHYLMALGFVRFSGFPQHYRYADLPLLLYGVCNIAEELRTDKLPVDTLKDNEAFVVCIYNYRPNLRNNPQQAFQNYLAGLEAKTKQFLNMDIFFGNVAAFDDISRIKKNYKQLKEEHRLTFYGKTENKQAKAASFYSSDVMNVLGEDWSKVRTAFSNKNKGGIASALDNIHAAARQIRLDPEVLNAKCSQWIRVLELEVDQPGDEDFHHCLNSSKRLEDTMVLLSRKIIELADRSQNNEPEKSSKIQQIDRYLSEHLSDNISLIDLADHLYLNPSYLSRYFKNETGMNFTDYVHKFKMKAACQMLKQKQYNIETIALKLGYTERTYFSKIFKKYIGVNPKDYR